MKLAIMVLPIFLLTACWSGITPPEVLTQEVEVTNNSSEPIKVESRYVSDYSSSACSNVDSFDDWLEPGETLSKQIKMDCSDTWTVDILLSFDRRNGEPFSEAIEVYNLKSNCEGLGISNERPGVAYIACDDRGCEPLCISDL